MQNPNSIDVSPQIEKYLNSKVSNTMTEQHEETGMQKLANTLMTFSNSNDVITSFITKEGSGTVHHLGSAILCINVIPFNFD